MVGIISTRPGFLAGMNDEGSYPVALSGRVPTKVTNENGAIKIGDPIVISSTPGVGMKATDATYVVGFALEPYDSKELGMISVFVRAGWFNGSAVKQADVTPSQLVMSGPLDMNSQPIIRIGALEGVDSAWSIDKDGIMKLKEIHAEKVQAKEFVIEADNVRKMVGNGVIPVGDSHVTIDNPSIKSNSQIFITFFNNIEGNWWISKRVDGSFEMSMNKIASTDIHFEYWFVNIVDNSAPASSDPPTTSLTDNPTSSQQDALITPSPVVEQPITSNTTDVVTSPAPQNTLPISLPASDQQNSPASYDTTSAAIQ